MKILVTGGAGFIGSHVAERLCKDHEVSVLDDMSGGVESNMPPNCALYFGDIRDRRVVETAVAASKPDAIIHLAAYAAEGLSPYIRAFNYDVNVVGSMNLISAAIENHVPRFVFASSAAVVGNGCGPIDPYGIAKKAVEDDLSLAHDEFGLSYAAVRMHNVFGERQNINDPYRNVVGIFMRQAMAGEPLTIFGDGEQRRQFTYVEYVSDVLCSLATQSVFDGVLAAGGDESWSVREMAAEVMQLFGQSELRTLPSRNEARDVRLDHGQSLRLFGPPLVGVKDGLSRMAEWVRSQNPRQPTPLPSDIEIPSRLPEYWRPRGPVAV